MKEWSGKIDKGNCPVLAFATSLLARIELALIFQELLEEVELLSGIFR